MRKFFFVFQIYDLSSRLTSLISRVLDAVYVAMCAVARAQEALSNFCCSFPLFSHSHIAEDCYHCWPHYRLWLSRIAFFVIYLLACLPVCGMKLTLCSGGGLQSAYLPLRCIAEQLCFQCTAVTDPRQRTVLALVQ